jgi:hypothetical protein
MVRFLPPPDKRGGSEKFLATTHDIQEPWRAGLDQA